MNIVIKVDEMLKEKIYQEYKNEFFARYLSESISTKKKELKKNGKWLGGIIPFGWKLKDDKMIKDAKQQKIIEYMKSLQKDGFSLRKISKKIKLKYNLNYSHCGVKNIMLRKEVKV